MRTMKLELQLDGDPGRTLHVSLRADGRLHWSYFHPVPAQPDFNMEICDWKGRSRSMWKRWSAYAPLVPVIDAAFKALAAQEDTA